MRARSREFRDRGSGGLSRAVAAVGAMAFAVSAMAAASGWLAAAEEPLSVKESESWDSERAFIEMERLRMEIRVLRGLASAQAALLAWNRERADGGAGPAVLAAGLCAEPALKPWCRTLPASFGAAADAGNDGQAEETLGPEDGVVFHRYWDIEQRAPRPNNDDTDATPAARGEDGVESGEDGSGDAEGVWTVDPEEQRTLRGVLEDWGARAGWTVVWNAERDYGLGAAASFEGGFLEAADLLLSGPATRRTLDARAYRVNRHLVVDDADGAGW